MRFRADSRFAPNQWETLLQSNTVSHWLGATLESALQLTQDFHTSMTKTSFATWCLVVTLLFCHGLENMCVSHLIYETKALRIWLDLSKYINFSKLCDRYAMVERIMQVYVVFISRNHLFVRCPCLLYLRWHTAACGGVCGNAAVGWWD